MSASPNNVPEDVEKQSVDELAEGHTADDAEPGSSSAQPAKRGRGRPKGSKNKKTLAAGAESSATPSVPRKRGRPPKEKKEDEEPAQKRPRGRPPKVKPAPAEGAASAEGGEPSVKKKRGRPPKNPAA